VGDKGLVTYSTHSDDDEISTDGVYDKDRVKID